jgi:hypothetical protein
MISMVVYAVLAGFLAGVTTMLAIRVRPSRSGALQSVAAALLLIDGKGVYARISRIEQPDSTGDRFNPPDL